MNKNKEKSKSNILIYTFLIILIIASIMFFGYNMLFNTDNTSLLINSGLLTLISINFLYCYKNKFRKIFILITSILLITFIIFNFLNQYGIINLVKLTPDFTNKNISEAITWAEDNKIEYIQVYENSDEIEEFNIITQSVAPNTPVYEIDNIKFFISSGPNYDKEVIISNMVGWNIDDAVEIIKTNFLNNVEIIYEINDNIEKDIIFEQSISGQLKRNDLLKLKVSLGSKESLKELEMIDLKNKSLFDATLWLKRNGINYELNYEFSKDTKRNYVINQDKKDGSIIDPNNDKIILTISKGSEIIVPNLLDMSTQEITEWVSSNKLKVKFIENYDTTVKMGNVISSNYKENDKIEEGSIIEVIISKGSLTMKNFNSLNEFRVWASNNNIDIIEEYEFNEEIEKGKIIRFSLSEGSVINVGDVITVYISNGKSVTIPNFIGKSKSSITSICNNIGLNCTFSYSYSNYTSSGLAISQNKKADSNVISGTYVNIVLSNGPKPNNNNNSSSGNSNSNNNNNNTNTQPTPPSCDSSKTVTVYITPGNDGSQTKAMIASAYPSIKWSFNMVNTCPNGSATSGEVCNASAIHRQNLNYCDTYTVTIVK